MSQIKLKHSGGNGVIIAAPSSNPAADRTLLLPGDGDSTIDTLGRAGNILQVVQNTTSTHASNTTTTFADTNLSATITPTSTSSKILIFISQTARVLMTGATGGGFQILRGSTVIQTPDPVQHYYANLASNVNVYFIHNTHMIDTPSTTSATTYKTQMKVVLAGSSREIEAQPEGASGNGLSTMTLFEVAA
tara:strand:+ start:123 stop:695 length:573 start_codon:yes stop_codon:yes gene_type:complete